MEKYPELEKLFEDKKPLDLSKTAELRDAIDHGLSAALFGKQSISELAKDIRRCVAEAGRFYPETLEDNQDAKNILHALLNEHPTRSKLETVWHHRMMIRTA